jgi:hypothetical protein
MYLEELRVIGFVLAALEYLGVKELAGCNMRLNRSFPTAAKTRVLSASVLNL